MSCNGCRVLRKGCSENCTLRPCLQWIDTPAAQAHATVFLAKFFGRAGLINFISAVPENQRQSLFQSLLYEAAGRTVDPVNGAVGLLSTGNWRVCQASVDTVLRGGALRPIPELIDGPPIMPKHGDPSEIDALRVQDPVIHQRSKVLKRRRACEPPLNMVQSKDLDVDQSLLPVKELPEKLRRGSPSMNSEESCVTTTCLNGGLRDYSCAEEGREVYLLNLFK